MDAFEEAVALLIGRHGIFQNGEIARRLGLSRQRVTLRLNRMVERGELVLRGRGRGRGAWYGQGPNYRISDTGLDQTFTVWTALMDSSDLFGYVRLTARGKTHFRTRDEAAGIIRQVNRMFLVVDFAGVETATPAFLGELFDVEQKGRHKVEAINASPELLPAIVSTKAELLRRKSPYRLRPPVRNERLEPTEEPHPDDTFDPELLKSMLADPEDD